MKAYKGFDKDLKCRDFQYEVGKEYEEKEAKACEKGFHACTNPLNVLQYYPPCYENRYCEVEQDGKFSENGDDSKVASTKIKIGKNGNYSDSNGGSGFGLEMGEIQLGVKTKIF